MKIYIDYFSKNKIIINKKIERNNLCFYIWACLIFLNYSLPDGKHKHNPRVMVTILIAKNADDATIQHDDPHYGSLVILHHWASGLVLTNEIRMLSF